jgi:hypothetical protein
LGKAHAVLLSIPSLSFPSLLFPVIFSKYGKPYYISSFLPPFLPPSLSAVIVKHGSEEMDSRIGRTILEEAEFEIIMIIPVTIM